MDNMVLGWITEARWAPSGDNFQPWEISYSLEPEIQINLKLAPHTFTDTSIMDVNYGPSIFALGAFAKNLQILAAGNGYSLNRCSYRGSNIKEGIFELVFDRGQVFPSSLQQWIPKRLTNRFPYKPIALSADHLAKIQSLVAEFKNTQSSFVPVLKASRIIKSLTSLDRMRYTNKPYFYDFLKALRFSNSSNEGLGIKTLGISPLFQLSLALVKKLKFLWVLNFLGIQYISSWMGCTNLLKNSSGILTFFTRSDSPQDWFDLGFNVQEAWLSLNSMGISVQPFASTLIVYKAHLENSRNLISGTPLFSQKKINSLIKKTSSFKAETGADLNLPVFVLRIGYASVTPKARAGRKNVTCNLSPTTEFLRTINQRGL